MKSSAAKRAIGLVLLYIGCFVLLVLLQFSRGGGFSERFGRLSVSASFPKVSGNANPAPLSCTLEYAGLRIEISQRYPAEIVLASGLSKELELHSLDKLPNGVRIRFDEGYELRAFAEAKTLESFSLTAAVPGGVQAPSALRLHAALAGRSRIVEASDGKRLVSGSGNYGLSLAFADFDAASASLVLRSVDGSMGSLALARIVETAVPVVAAKASDGPGSQSPRDPAAFKAAVDAWRDKVWKGLSLDRLDAERLTWRGLDPNSTALFSEKALTAYLAESLLRGVYSEALVKTRRVKELWPSDLTYLTAPYLGGIIARMRALETADLGEAGRLARIVHDKSPELFMKEGLVRFMFDRARGTLSSDILQFVPSVDIAKLTIRQAAGFLGCAVDSRAYLKDADNPFIAPAAVAAERLAAAVKKGPAGLYLASEDDGSSDMRLSLLAGSWFIAHGEAANLPAYVGLGQGLVEGYLAMADDRGFAPARLLVRQGAIEQRSGAFAPEDAYPILAANPYYPRQVSFYRVAAPGVWAWTCAARFSLAMRSGVWEFNADFPQGASEHAALYGIRSFSRIQLYDIDYSPDAEFETYDAPGYLYQGDRQALYVKLKHKSKTEAIRLFF